MGRYDEILLEKDTFSKSLRVKFRCLEKLLFWSNYPKCSQPIRQIAEFLKAQHLKDELSCQVTFLWRDICRNSKRVHTSFSSGHCLV